MIWKYVRTSGRLAHFFWVLFSASVKYLFLIRLRGKSSSISARAEWMRDCARGILSALNIHVEIQGVPPKNGVLASNHLGYIDIVVLGSVKPTVFLSKSEVRNWPVFGPMAAWAGTLFIRRDKKSDVVRFDEPFAAVVNAEVLLGIFPEGTSTDGHRVLPFHSSLFAAAAEAKWPVTPVWIGYASAHGSVENDVCYWGDMTFFPHFLRLATLEKIQVTVVFGALIAGAPDRKQLARQLHREVCNLGGRQRPELRSSTLLQSPGGPLPAVVARHS